MRGFLEHSLRIATWNERKLALLDYMLSPPKKLENVCINSGVCKQHLLLHTNVFEIYTPESLHASVLGLGRE
jgi:hypothetical protein